MKQLSIFIFLFVSIATGCTEFEEPTPSVQDADPVVAAGLTRTANTTTFEVLENPYALDLMQAIYDDYEGGTELQPTDLYVRFKPQDADQLNVLQDQGLELFDHPLDLDIPAGATYVDPTIPEGEPVWLYTTVKPDFVFPAGITHEILEACYIPAEGESIEVPTSTRAGGSVDVELEALYRSGFVADPEPVTRARVRPSGKIRVENNSTSELVGVQGVKIRCHVVVKWSTTFTDAEGNYTMDSKFLFGPHYAIVYKNAKGFTIWGNWAFLAAANHNMGWHSNRGYSQDIYKGSGAWEWSVANNAGYQYYSMCERTGIPKPPSKLKMWMFRNGTKRSAPMMRRLSVAQVMTKDNWTAYLSVLLIPITVLDGLLKWAEPDLIIGTGDKKTYREIYSVVNHELSHASHFSQVGSSYWSKYISHIIDKNGYGSDRSGTYAGICEVGEMWGYAMEYIQEYEQFSLATDVPYPEEDPVGGWIRPDPIWALITRGVLTKKQVFASMTSDVDGVDKWVRKLGSMYPSKAEAITTAFTWNDVPTITGPDKPRLNFSETYRVPEAVNLRGNMVFAGWTVTPNSGYTVTGGLSNRALTIRFPAEGGIYTLAANFILPDGTTYSAKKTITSPLKKPVITGTSGFHHVFTVSNPVAGATYQWEVNGKLIDQSIAFLPQLIVTATGAILSDGPILHLLAQPTSFTVRCRATHNGETSEWSEAVTLLADNGGGGGGGGGGGSTGFSTPVLSGSHFTTGNYVRFLVTNPTPGATYRWEINGILVDAKANSSELRVNENGVPQLPEVFAPIGDPVLFANATFISARCQATLNGSTTKWSAASTVTIFGSTF